MKKIIWMVLLIITSSFCIAASPITTSENDEINETVTVEVIKTEAVEEVSFSPKEEVVVQEQRHKTLPAKFILIFQMTILS